MCAGEVSALFASGGDDYTWLAEDNSVLGNTASLNVMPTASHTYRVIIRENSCQYDSTIRVPVTIAPPPATVVTSSNDIDCSVGEATLHVTGGSTYVWDPLPGISQYTIVNPVVKPRQTTTYYVTATSANGCARRDSVTVVVDFTKALNKYSVPNAFTPNNDGKNDCFGVRTWSGIQELEFSIFNRWGQKVFSAKDPTQCWNGVYKGLPQPSGGYPYIIKATTLCGTAVRKGIIMLVR
jgi:gliding motility-associated-like protein